MTTLKIEAIKARIFDVERAISFQQNQYNRFGTGCGFLNNSKGELKELEAKLEAAEAEALEEQAAMAEEERFLFFNEF